MSTQPEPLSPGAFAESAPERTAARREINPDDPPWAVPGAVAVWVGSVMLMVVMQGLFLVPYATTQGVPSESLGDFALSNPTAIFLQVISIIPAHLLTLGAAWLLVTRAGRQPFLKALGWDWDARFTFWRSAGLAVALLLVGLGIIRLTGYPETPLDKIINSSRMTAVTIAFVATATAPLVEEVVYRGVLYSALRRALGAVWAVGIVLLLFALVHVPQYWPHFGILLAICMLSLVLTLVRAKTKSLLPCFIIHLIFNGVQAVLIVLQPYLPELDPERLQGAHLARLAGHLAALFV